MKENAYKNVLIAPLVKMNNVINVMLIKVVILVKAKMMVNVFHVRSN